MKEIRNVKEIDGKREKYKNRVAKAKKMHTNTYTQREGKKEKQGGGLTLPHSSQRLCLRLREFIRSLVL